MTKRATLAATPSPQQREPIAPFAGSRETGVSSADTGRNASLSFEIPTAVGDGARAEQRGPSVRLPVVNSERTDGVSSLTLPTLADPFGDTPRRLFRAA